MNPVMNVSTPPIKAPLVRNQCAVLLVDDDTFQLELLSGILRKLGVTNVTAVQGGAQALDKLNGLGAHFDLILMDLHMPGMDGFQFMEALAKTGFSGELIIVSGQNEEVMRAATLVARLRRFTLLGSVSKPVRQQALSALI
jgi:CheY-like chemotaxis protein